MVLPLTLDHIVILVADLDAAVTAYQGLGFHVVPGGRHASATHNALIGFDDGAYVELIAFYETAPHHRWWPRLVAGGGMIAVCLHTTDVQAAVTALRAHGIPMTALEAQSRTRPDGVRLAWQLSFHDVGRDLLPFLIQDTTPRANRVPPGAPHPNGCRAIGSLTFAVHDLSMVEKWVTAIGADAEHMDAAELDAHGLRCWIGAHDFDFLTPRDPVGRLAAVLRDRGPGPCSYGFMGADGREIEVS